MGGEGFDFRESNRLPRISNGFARRHIAGTTGLDAWGGGGEICIPLVVLVAKIIYLFYIIILLLLLFLFR